MFEKLKPYAYLLASFFLFIGCMCLGIFDIGFNSLSGDEPFSVFHAQLSVKAIIAELSKGNNPPFYEIILHYWIKAFGIGVFSVRLLSALFMSLAAVVVFQIGRLFNTKVAILAGLLFVFSNYQLAFAHESRVYALFVLLTSISMFLYIQLAAGNKAKYYPWLYVLASVLLIYSHFFGFFVLFTQALSTIVIKEVRTAFFKRHLKYLSIAMAFYLPYIYVFVTRFFDSAFHGTWLWPVHDLGPIHDILFLLTNKSSLVYVLVLVIVFISVQPFVFKSGLKTYLKYVLYAFSVFFLFFSISTLIPLPFYWRFTSNPVVMVSYVGFVVLFIGWACLSNNITLKFKVVLLWFLVPLLTMFVLSFWVPMFLDRYVLFTLPAFYLLLSIAVFQFRKDIQIAFGVLLIALMAYTHIYKDRNRNDVASLVDKVKQLKSIHSIVYICPDHFDLNFAYYYNALYFKNVFDENPKQLLQNHLREEHIFPITQYTEIDTCLFSKADKVIYIDAGADFSYRDNRIYDYLTSHFGKGKLFGYNGKYKLYEFTKN